MRQGYQSSRGWMFLNCFDTRIISLLTCS